MMRTTTLIVLQVPSGISYQLYYISVLQFQLVFKNHLLLGNPPVGYNRKTRVCSTLAVRC